MVKVQRLFAKTNLKIRVCEAMKAPVGLLSGSAVCDSRWRGVAPTSTPNKSTSEIRRSLRSEVPDGPSSARGQEPSASVGGSFCFAGALRDGVVYSAQFNNSEFVERFPELSLFYRLFSPLNSEMICIFPYFCPYAESAREIREIFS